MTLSCKNQRCSFPVWRRPYATIATDEWDSVGTAE